MELAAGHRQQRLTTQLKKRRSSPPHCTKTKPTVFSRLLLLGSSGAIVCFVSISRLGVKNANHQHDVEDEANAHAAHERGEVRHVGFPDSCALYIDQM